jgi:hypothetical protein
MKGVMRFGMLVAVCIFFMTLTTGCVDKLDKVANAMRMIDAGVNLINAVGSNDQQQAQQQTLPPPQGEWQNPDSQIVLEPSALQKALSRWASSDDRARMDKVLDQKSSKKKEWTHQITKVRFELVPREKVEVSHVVKKPLAEYQQYQQCRSVSMIVTTPQKERMETDGIMCKKYDNFWEVAGESDYWEQMKKRV